MLECGPKCVGSVDPGKSARTLISETQGKYNLRTQVLLYTREDRLAHTNHNVGGQYVDVDDVEELYRSLNANGLPFNLALNGSPDYGRHIPFDEEELKYLGELQGSGVNAGVRNVVTVADNALVHPLKEYFPELTVVASCISVAFDPNLVTFRNSRGIEYESPDFLIEYYRHLYSIYDMVVPIPQLTTPGFLAALNLTKEELARKTILFMNLGCGSPFIGRCVEHYKGIRDRVMPDMPVIPDEYIVKPEDRHASEPSSSCSQSFSSLELMNRFRDLRSLWEMGISQFKIPARSSGAKDVFDFLCRFVTQDQVADSIPEDPLSWGYSPAHIKLSFMGNYPPRVHGVLRDYSWPGFDSHNGDGYCGHTAYSIQKELHSMALGL